MLVEKSCAQSNLVQPRLRPRNPLKLVKIAKSHSVSRGQGTAKQRKALSECSRDERINKLLEQIERIL